MYFLNSPLIEGREYYLGGVPKSSIMTFANSQTKFVLSKDPEKNALFQALRSHIRIPSSITKVDDIFFRSNLDKKMLAAFILNLHQTYPKNKNREWASIRSCQGDNSHRLSRFVFIPHTNFEDEIDMWHVQAHYTSPGSMRPAGCDPKYYYATLFPSGEFN